MPSKHAKLSPSASDRWISCPASIRMEQELLDNGWVDEPSIYAEEGTAAHALGELKARFLILGDMGADAYTVQHAAWRAEFWDYVDTEEKLAEMERHTEAYVELIRERLALYPNSVLMLERRLSPGVPSCWGTSDAVIVSPVHIEIIDFKYGSGVAVEAEGNPQLRLYGLGALEEYGDVLGETKIIRITVHQPRLDHVLTEEITPKKLRKWRTKVVLPAAELALGDDAPFGPSEEACRWCPASGTCQAQLEDIFGDVDFDEDPITLSPGEIADLVLKLPKIMAWAKAIEAQALHLAYSKGVPLPGLKVVRSGGQRGIRDADAAVKTLIEHGYAIEQVTNPAKPKGIGELEKLLGKEKFKELLEDTKIVTKSEGRESLAPEDDKRPAITPNTEAAKDFK